MRCIGCGSEAVTERPERTAQGYRRFRCRACGKQFNERSGTVLNRTQYPSDVIALVVLWRLRYKLSLRDLPEMFRSAAWCSAMRPSASGRPSSPRPWPRTCGGAVAARRAGAGTSMRPTSRSRALVLSVSRHRPLRRAGGRAVQRAPRHGGRAAFFRSAKAVTGITPDRVTTDGHDSYPRAIRTELGKGCATGPAAT